MLSFLHDSEVNDGKSKPYFMADRYESSSSYDMHVSSSSYVCILHGRQPPAGHRGQQPSHTGRIRTHPWAGRMRVRVGIPGPRRRPSLESHGLISMHRWALQAESSIEQGTGSTNWVYELGLGVLLNRAGRSHAWPATWAKRYFCEKSSQYFGWYYRQQIEVCWDARIGSTNWVHELGLGVLLRTAVYVSSLARCEDFLDSLPNTFRDRNLGVDLASFYSIYVCCIHNKVPSFCWH